MMMGRSVSRRLAREGPPGQRAHPRAGAGAAGGERGAHREWAGSAHRDREGIAERTGTGQGAHRDRAGNAPGPGRERTGTGQGAHLAGPAGSGSERQTGNQHRPHVLPLKLLRILLGKRGMSLSVLAGVCQVCLPYGAPRRSSCFRSVGKAQRARSTENFASSFRSDGRETRERGRKQHLAVSAMPETFGVAVICLPAQAHPRALLRRKIQTCHRLRTPRRSQHPSSPRAACPACLGLAPS